MNEEAHGNSVASDHCPARLAPDIGPKLQSPQTTALGNSHLPLAYKKERTRTMYQTREWQEISRLAQTGQRAKLLRYIESLGPSGRMLAATLRIIGVSGPSSVEQAIGVLRGRGYEVFSADEQLALPMGLDLMPPGNRSNMPAIAAPNVRTVSSVPRPAAHEDRIDSRMIAGAGGVKGTLQWNQTPGSSNVYAFAFDPLPDNDNFGILYVQFKAAGGAVSRRRDTNRCAGDDHNIYHRAHAPGPIYAFGSGGNGAVPKWVYDEFKSNSSPGRMVWQHLRQCGSQQSDQYPSALVTTASAEAGFGYTPRRLQPVNDQAERYRPRNVPQVGRSVA